MAINIQPYPRVRFPHFYMVPEPPSRLFFFLLPAAGCLSLPPSSQSPAASPPPSPAGQPPPSVAPAHHRQQRRATGRPSAALCRARPPQGAAQTRRQGPGAPAPTGLTPPHCRPRPAPPPTGRAPASFPLTGHRTSFPLPPSLRPSVERIRPGAPLSSPTPAHATPRRRQEHPPGGPRPCLVLCRAAPDAAHLVVPFLPQCVLRRLSKPHLPAPADRAPALAAPRPSCTGPCSPDLRRPPPATVWPLSRCAGACSSQAMPQVGRPRRSSLLPQRPPALPQGVGESRLEGGGGE